MVMEDATPLNGIVEVYILLYVLAIEEPFKQYLPLQKSTHFELSKTMRIVVRQKCAHDIHLISRFCFHM